MHANSSQAERKARQYEELLAQQRPIQAQMALIDPETRREVDEVRRMEQDITRFTSGVLSEPTTPPEYHSSAYPTFVSRPNRYSSTSMASPPGLSNRTSRSGSQLTSPPTSFARPVTSQVIMQNPSQSVPGSRRNSDEEEEDDYIYQFTGNPHRAAAKYVILSLHVRCFMFSIRFRKGLATYYCGIIPSHSNFITFAITIIYFHY